MNKFLQGEEVGRRYWEQLLIKNKVTDYQFEKDEYSAWDCTYIWNNITFLVEIKVRNCSSTEYPDFILETDKCNNILNECLQNNYRGLYVNFFNDGIVVIWDLNKVKDNPDILKNCRKTTSVYSGYKDKLVKLITLNQAIKVGKYNINNN